MYYVCIYIYIYIYIRCGHQPSVTSRPLGQASTLVIITMFVIMIMFISSNSSSSSSSRSTTIVIIILININNNDIIIIIITIIIINITIILCLLCAPGSTLSWAQREHGGCRAPPYGYQTTLKYNMILLTITNCINYRGLIDNMLY